MYRAFKLEDIKFKQDFSEHAEEMNRAYGEMVRKSLKAFVDAGKIDGTKMGDNWFPQIDAEIFISHAHQDEALALNLAGWLHSTFKIRSFIDSCVWGHSTKILRQIAVDHCRTDDKRHFDYDLRNGSTSHIHMMLATALGKMINSVEAVIFVSTPNSVSTKESIQRVSSPWLLYELSLMQLIQKRPLNDYRKMKKSADIHELEEGVENFSRTIPIDYDADFSSLTSLDADTLNSWELTNSKRPAWAERPLDILYSLAPEPGWK